MTTVQTAQVPTAERICRCAAPLLMTQADRKWANERRCKRCGLLAPLAFRL